MFFSLTGSLCSSCIKEIYSIKLPGDPKLGEGKPENQNHAIVFTRGDALHTIDMNQVRTLFHDNFLFLFLEQLCMISVLFYISYYMSQSHCLANFILLYFTQILYFWPYKDYFGHISHQCYFSKHTPHVVRLKLKHGQIRADNRSRVVFVSLGKA